MDQPVHYMTYWALPFTGGGDAVLRKGTRVRISSALPEPEPLGAYAEPLDYEKTEAEIIPAMDREDPKYRGFALTLDTVDLNRNFTLVEPAPDKRRKSSRGIAKREGRR
jgi:hypothetical protein